MTWVDLALLAILVLSVVVGLIRGFVFEVLSLLGWVAAIIVAWWAGPELAVHLPIGEPGSGLRAGVGFAVTFFVALLLCGLLARLVRGLVRASPLSGIDRLLGAGFGAARGVLLLFVVVVLTMLTPLRTSEAWRQSQGASWVNAFLQDLKPSLPPEVTRHLPIGPPGRDARPGSGLESLRT